MLVLPHGVDAVEHVSANVLEILGVPVNDVLGRSPRDLFSDPKSKEKLGELLRPGMMFFDNPCMLTANGERFEAISHVRDGKLIIEIEPYADADRDYPTLVAEATEQLSKQRSIDGLYKSAVDMMHYVTGFDRVKLYKFVSHGHGKVVAEKHAPGSQLPASFLNYHFAASDIPADAKEILLTGKTRAKPQSSTPSVPLMTRSADGHVGQSGPVVDMTDAWLRGIHECDNGYNRNIGVGSNRIFPVNVDDTIWGLFVVHNLEEKFLAYDSRAVIEQMTMMFISKLIELEAVDARIDDRYKIGSSLVAVVDNGRRIIEQIGESRAETSWIHKKTLQTVSQQIAALGPRLFDPEDSRRPFEALEKTEIDLLNLMDADGVAVVRSGRRGHVNLIGTTPDVLTVRGIVAQFGDSLPSIFDSQYRVFATDALCDLVSMSDAVREVACGMVAVSVGDDPGNYVIWFRAEAVIDATWAGKPPTAADLSSPRMFRPKKSFAPHQQALRGASRPWLEIEVRLASEFGEAISAIWRKSADRRRPVEPRRRPAEMINSHGLNAGLGAYVEPAPKRYLGSSDMSRMNGSTDYSHDFEPM
jgi:light-regulated signal transduction histidine kinase (bacteriophytochrome)